MYTVHYVVRACILLPLSGPLSQRANDKFKSYNVYLQYFQNAKFLTEYKET
jgi:hypothetical protein